MSLPSVPKGAHVGILGGSFDPPHLSHQLLALSALALEPLDALWVMPCADHPFAKVFCKRNAEMAIGSQK